MPAPSIDETYDTRAQLAASSVSGAILSVQAMGYYAVGDCPVIGYKRVAAQPSHAGKVRSVDRFLPDGSTDSVKGGWWEMIMSGLQDVRKFGVKSDGTDCTKQIQAAIGAISVVFPAGSYAASDVISIPSNRTIWIQVGATITNTGGRLSANVPGGGNIHIINHGVLYFPATKQKPQLGDWPAGGGWPQRGLIELGGSAASPAHNLSVRGDKLGRIYSDYVWAGVPTDLTNNLFQLNRKGIAFFNARNCLCDGMEVDHVYGEAIYYNAGSNDTAFDVKFTNNYVHDCAFDALNFNSTTSVDGLLIANNTVRRAFSGIEISAGTADSNDIDTCYRGIQFGGGGGVGPLRITNNKATSCHVAYDLEFASIVQNVVITGNQAIATDTSAYIVNNIQFFQFKDNSSYYHAATGAGPAYNIASGTDSGHLTGNITANAGPHSTGTFVNAGSNIVGTNPSF